MTISGGCLCSGVRFEIRGALFAPALCHCSMCRKAHGAAFRPGAVARRRDFQWLAGEDLVTAYASSASIRRTFCRTCGSPLVAFSEDRPEIVSVALGALDGDPGIRPAAHWNVASKAQWYDITDDLPQYATHPGATQG
jgi:hypothetical protein